MLELTNGENADLQLYKQKITDEIATVTINSKKQNICCLFIPYLIFSWFMRHYSRLYRCQRDFQWGSSPPTLNYRFTKALSQVPYYFFFLRIVASYSSSANIPHPSMLYPPPSSPFIEIQPGIQALPLSWHHSATERRGENYNENKYMYQFLNH